MNAITGLVILMVCTVGLVICLSLMGFVHGFNTVCNKYHDSIEEYFNAHFIGNEDTKTNLVHSLNWQTL